MLRCEATGVVPLMGEVHCELPNKHSGKHKGRIITRRRDCIIEWSDGEDLNTAKHEWVSGGLEERFMDA